MNAQAQEIQANEGTPPASPSFRKALASPPEPPRPIWERIPQPIQRKLLDNVWGSACRKGTTMVRYSGQVKEGDLVLAGICATSGEKGARWVETT